MIKYKCQCGEINIIIDYKMHLEGTLTFREYDFSCKKCQKNINFRDINENDLIEQEFLC